MSVQVQENGDLFTSGAGVLVNPVNCVGTMGAGLALAFKKRFPHNFGAYAQACRNKELRPGGLLAVREHSKEGSVWVVNLATKDHWRDDSKIEWIAAGSQALREWAESQGVSDVACPALGAGYGNLPWSAVRATVEAAFEGSHVDLLLFAPRDSRPAHVPKFGMR